jgi:hypothetical protein
MSTIAAVLERAPSAAAPPAPLRPLPRSGEYPDLIRRLFQSRAVVAVIGAGSGSRSEKACRGIAAELAANGHRVVVVRVGTLLLANRFPAATGCLPLRMPNVWLWPSPHDAPAEFFPSPLAPSPESDWLASLRRDFDSVLLECPPVKVAPATAEFAALADAAVLVVESRQIARQQIQRDQRALELRGVKLAGCVLMRQR